MGSRHAGHRLPGRPHVRVVVALALAIAAGANGTNLDDLHFNHGIAFFHDLKYPADFTHFDYLNPNAPKGGVLIESTQQAFNTLAPMRDGGIQPPSGFWFSSETLLVRAGDEVSAFYGRLADGVAITDDRLAMVFRIHPDARWSDGVPITSRDVEFTIEVNQERIASRLFYSFIQSVERIDDRHVAIHLEHPLTLNHIIMMQFMSIVPAHYWETRDMTAHTTEVPVMSGPYRIADMKLGRYVEWRRNADYWGRDIPVNKGRYNFDVVRYEVYRDATVIRESFRKGLIDIWTEGDVRYWHKSYDVPAFDKGWIKKMRRHFGIEIGIRRAIGLNNRLAKFRDRRVRHALTLAFDFDWQNRILHAGQHKRAHSYFPDTILAATGLPSADELALLEPFRADLPAELFDRPFEFAATPTPDVHRDHLVRARDLLADAGWRIVDGVLVNADGETMTIEFLSRSADDARTLLPYFANLARLGIDANMRLVESAQYINLMRDYDFDATLKNQDILMPPVIELGPTYHSDTVFEPMSRNTAGVSHPAIDHLIDAAERATTLPEMVAACRALDRVLLWQYYQIPLYAVDLRRTVYWDKFGIPDFAAEYWPAFPDGWWYDEAKAARIDIDAIR